jgi:hypothetical protein
MKRNQLVVEIISGLFILLFVYTGVNKLIAIDTLKFVLSKYPLIQKFPVLVAWALPMIELLVAALLFFPKTKLIGLYSSLILVIGFTCYLSYMLLFTSKLPCTCGGMLQKLTWPQHLGLNIFFIVLSLIGISLKKGNTKKEKLEDTQIVFT